MPENSDQVEPTAFELAMYEARRKERRDGVKLIIIGILFAACGVLLTIVGAAWMGPLGICFGAMSIVGGIVYLRGQESPRSRILIIVVCALFAAVSVLMVLSGLIAPGEWGWRGGLSAVIFGAVGVLFFGGGTVLLIIKEVRRRHR